MTLEMLRDFLFWCMVINVGLLLLSLIFMTCAHGFIFRMHGRWFHLTEEAFSLAIYKFLAFYKILILCFNAVPYIALRIIA